MQTKIASGKKCETTTKPFCKHFNNLEQVNIHKLAVIMDEQKVYPAVILPGVFNSVI